MVENKIKMSDEDLLDYIQACWTESDEVWKNDQKPTVDNCWNLYRIYRDYSKKKDWQMKHVNPRAFAAVEIAVALTKRALVQQKDFYSVKGQDSGDKKNETRVKSGINYYLRKAKFKQNFLEALKMSMISGIGVMKMYWKRWEEEYTAVETKVKYESVELFGIKIPGLRKPKTIREEIIKTVQKSELIIESKDIENIRVDPFCSFVQRPKYIIEIEETDFSQIVKLADEGYYENIDQLRESLTIDKTSEKMADMGDKVPVSGREMTPDFGHGELPSAEKSQYRKPVVLKHFWGDIEVEKEINPDKKIQLYENWNIVVANDKYIIRKKKNPHTHGKYPYIFVPCIIIPYRFMPIGLIEPVATTLDYLDDLMNFTGDALKFDVASMFAVDLESVEDPVNDLVVEPGHFIKMKTAGQNINQSMQQLQGGTKNIVGALNFVKYLDQIVQLASGAVDPVLGMLTKQDTTATEFRGTLNQSTVRFESIAADIEEFTIGPMIEMAYQLIFQNMDAGMWMEVLGEDGIPMREYITPESINGNFDFHANGITGYLAQLEYISKMVSAVGTLVQAQPIVQLSPVEGRKIFKLIFEAQGLKDINDIISDQPTQMAAPMGGEPAEQPANPELAPENVAQMMNKGGMM